MLFLRQTNPISHFHRMKKTIFPFISILLALTCLMACGGVERKASAKLDIAKQAYAQGDYARAKAELDSIKTLYPKAFDTRREGNRLERRVELAVQRLAMARLDSLLSATQARLEQLKPAYAFEKDEEYQQTGTYLHPSQVVERNLHRSFLRFQVDEQGKVSMTSIYCGRTSIHHTSVKVSAPDGTFAQTPASPDSYETTDLGEHIEKADYKLKQDGGVIEFVALNPDKSLRVDFMGDRTYTTHLTKTDKQAAGAILELAEVLDSIAQVKHDMEECRLKIGFLEERIKRDSLETLNK